MIERLKLKSAANNHSHIIEFYFKVNEIIAYVEAMEKELDKLMGRNKKIEVSKP